MDEMATPYLYASVGYSRSIVYMKTPLDEMREARTWLEGIREERRAAQEFVWDWPIWPTDAPGVRVYA